MTRGSPPAEWTAGPRRPIPLRYLGLIAVLAIGSPFIGYASWDRVEAWRLSGRLAAIERAGEPVRVPADESAAARTEEQKRASRLYSEATRLMSGANGRQILEAGALITALSALAPADAAGDPRARQLGAIEDGYTRVLALLDQATPLDADGYAPGEQPTYPLEDQRLASPNAMRIARLAFAGESEAAARALLGTLRIRRMFPARYRGNALPTAHSLELVLSSGPISTPLLGQLQREYVALDGDFDVASRLVDDRARFVGWTVTAGAAGPSPSGAVAVRRLPPFEALAVRLLRPMRRHALVAALDDYAGAIEVARVPWPAKLDATDARAGGTGRPRLPARASMLQRAAAPWGEAIGTQALVNTVARTVVALARARAATAALAVARYRVDHAGALPARLDALVPAYLAAVPQDPFSGAPMRWWVADGPAYKVYSVGMNRKDDGGRWYVASDLLPGRGSPEDLGIAVGPRVRAVLSGVPVL